MLKVAVIIGTRPEAIKMAPVVRMLEEHPEAFAVHTCATAQHRGMLDQVVAHFGIRIAHDLDIMTPGQGLARVTARAVEGVQAFLDGIAPDWVLVQGDTTTTFAAALAAFYGRVPVGHVEAGLRTGDPDHPYPEEMNRRLTGALATLHFAPTRAGCDNLLRENVRREDIRVTGNTAIDALQMVLAEPRPAALPRLFPADRRGILVTAHRRESFGAGLRSICAALRRLAGRRSDIHLVYPLHPNPNVRDVAIDALSGLSNVTLTDPLDYRSFVWAMAESALILTDSGGIQEEAPSLGKPVLVLRDCTERPEAIAAGVARLVGTDEGHIVRETERLLDDEAAYAAMARAVNPYGDGHAAERIGAELLRRAGAWSDTWPAGEFVPGAN
jgi:UDP-N-acetylglucosamine 2-epimerase (non-hydrolysing)